MEIKSDDLIKILGGYVYGCTDTYLTGNGSSCVICGRYKAYERGHAKDCNVNIAIEAFDHLKNGGTVTIIDTGIT